MTKNKFKQSLYLKIAVAFIAILIVGSTGYQIARAEIGTGTPESGVVSRIKTLYTDVSALTFGSDTDTPDWGAYWNRIKTAAKWTPTVTSTVTDVKSGKTFVPSGSRTNSTGTYPNPTNCLTQQWHDSHASATEGNNCSLAWTTPSSPATGDDARGVVNGVSRGAQDPRTGLIWSQLLLNSANTVVFSPTTNSAWSWNNSTDADNVAVGGKTASQLCSERGSGWRLPTQKELMQAYIDGSYFNLTQPSTNFWSVTEVDASNAWVVNLNVGYTVDVAKTNSYQVRCVR